MWLVGIGGFWRLGRGLMFGKMGVDVLCGIIFKMDGRGWKLVKVEWLLLTITTYLTDQIISIIHSSDANRIGLKMKHNIEST